jgi:hypothetical protein
LKNFETTGDRKRQRQRWTLFGSAALMAGAVLIVHLVDDVSG